MSQQDDISEMVDKNPNWQRISQCVVHIIIHIWRTQMMNTGNDVVFINGFRIMVSLSDAVRSQTWKGRGA